MDPATRIRDLLLALATIRDGIAVLSTELDPAFKLNAEVAYEALRMVEHHVLDLKVLNRELENTKARRAITDAPRVIR